MRWWPCELGRQTGSRRPSTGDLPVCLDGRDPPRGVQVRSLKSLTEFDAGSSSRFSVLRNKGVKVGSR